MIIVDGLGGKIVAGLTFSISTCDGTRIFSLVIAFGRVVVTTGIVCS
jgi:hypothetical protein